MSERSEKKEKHSHKRKNIVKEYVLTNTIFIVIALAFAISALFAVFDPAAAFVHKVENACGMSIGDVEIDKSAAMTAYDENATQYGDYVADILCESRGLNTPVYAGINRVSARYGAGWSMKTDFFASQGSAVAAGYDETYFASLKYIEAGDRITVTTAKGDLSYQVTDAYYESTDLNVDDAQSDLVLYSSFSDFSENAGKCYYVFADKISGEGN